MSTEDKPTASIEAPEMLAEVIPPRVLPQTLTRFNLVTLYFALIFGSYGAAQMSAGGWAGIPMMLLAGVTFLLPCVFAAYELGTLFPGEGGIYIWAHKTAGPVHGFIAGWLSWVPIFFLLPLGAVTIVAHIQLILGTQWALSTQVAAQCAIVCVVTLISLMRLRFSQGYINVMFFVAAGTAIAAFAAGLLKSPAATPIDRDIYSLDLVKHGALYSSAVLWLLGVEVPFNMGAEFKDHKRAAGTMFLWGSLALMIGYLVGIAGVLWTTPVAQVDSTTAVAKAVGTLWPVGGGLVAFCICLAVSSQDVAYMNSYSRLLFISGIEKRLPAVFGQITSESRVPVPALVLQALGAMAVILIFSTQPNLAVAFNLYIAALVTVWCAALFYIYVGIVRARRLCQRQYAARKSLVWQIPGGRFGLWFVAVWGAVFNAVAIYYVFANPMTTAIPAKEWRQWLTVIALAIVGSGVLIFFAGRRRLAEVDVDDEVRRYLESIKDRRS